MSETLTHGMNCSALNPMSESDCTCGLEWRIQLQTEQEMHNAWRKRAEEAEAREAELLEMGQAMFHALRSYEYGNASPDLAAEACTKYAQRWVKTL